MLNTRSTPLIKFESGRPVFTNTVAKRLGVPVRTVRHWAQVGKLRGFKDSHTPKLWRFYPTEIDRFSSTWQGQGGDGTR